MVRNYGSDCLIINIYLNDYSGVDQTFCEISRLQSWSFIVRIGRLGIPQTH